MLGRRAKWKETTEWWTDNARACRRAALSADEHRSTAMSWTTRPQNTCRREETAFDDDDKAATAANKEIMHDAHLQEWVMIDDDDNDDDGEEGEQRFLVR
jgi:hypothetical protein